MTFINSELIGEFTICVPFPKVNRIETLFSVDSIIKGTIIPLSLPNLLMTKKQAKEIKSIITYY